MLINELNDFLRKMNINYAICGGYAIDGYIGNLTRKHKDLDVSVFTEDRDNIIAQMLDMGWLIFEPCGCQYLHRIKNIENQRKVKVNIWCIKPANTHYTLIEHEDDMYEIIHDGAEQCQLDYIEFLFNKKDSESFIYSRNHSIKRSLEKAILDINEIRYLAPEVVILYKSTAYDNKDYQSDFENVLPLLNEESREWLKSAFTAAYPDGHVWLTKMLKD